MGERPQLGESEWATIIDTVTRTAKGPVPVMAGINCKDTVRTIDDIKKVSDMGAIGVLIYNTHWYPFGAVHPETFFCAMSDFEYVVGMKWSPPEGYLRRCRPFQHH